MIGMVSLGAGRSPRVASETALGGVRGPPPFSPECLSSADASGLTTTMGGAIPALSGFGNLRSVPEDATLARLEAEEAEEPLVVGKVWLLVFGRWLPGTAG